MKFFFDKNTSFLPLKNKTIGVIGFGSQGEAQAKNLLDSGLKVIIGLRKKSKSLIKAKKYGFKVFTVSDAVKKADIIHLLIPDEVDDVLDTLVSAFPLSSLCEELGWGQDRRSRSRFYGWDRQPTGLLT